jgi:hypothetical protein
MLILVDFLGNLVTFHVIKKRIQKMHRYIISKYDVRSDRASAQHAWVSAESLYDPC